MLLALPCPSTLKPYIRKATINPGFDTKILEIASAIFQTTDLKGTEKYIPGTIMFDELICQSNVQVNVANGSVIGYCCSDEDLHNLGGSDTAPAFTRYILQFYFRSLFD